MNNKLINLVSYLKNENKPIKGKKAFQKIVYFLSLIDFDFNYDYKIHLFGPYSRELESDLIELEECNQITISKLSEYSYSIEPNINHSLDSIPESFKWINDNFASLEPKTLELHSTTHFVANTLAIYYNINEDEKIVNNVKRIKGKKYSEENIKESIQKLRKLNLIESRDIALAL